MLKAKLDSARKNKKGFSLVELIIVIAIMVALIAVMAPQFVKYVKSSREASLQQAAEDALSTAKAEYALGNLQGEGDITVVRDSTTEKLTITLGTGLSYTNADGSTFVSVCGIDTTKKIATDTEWKISISKVNGAPQFEMSSSMS